MQGIEDKIMLTGGSWCLLVTCQLVSSCANKYVLSILQFQYPTIFQCWQTLIGATFFKILHSSGYINLEIHKLQCVVLPWLPCIFLFTCSVYAGSVALSNLSIPTFLALQNVVLAVQCIVKQFTSKHNSKALVKTVVCFILVCISSIGIYLTDSETASTGYAWMLGHIVLTIGWMMYPKVAVSVPHLNEPTKMFLLYSGSAVLLLPSTFILGDVLASRHFPFWYHQRFHVGCVLSGISGPAVIVCAQHFKEHLYLVRLVNPLSVSKVVTSLVASVLLQDMTTASHIFWLSVNLLVCIILTPPACDNQSSSVVSDTINAVKGLQNDITANSDLKPPLILQKDIKFTPL